MKKISLKMSNDFKIVPLCKNNIYALENNSAMIEIDCEVRSDLSYKLHIQSKNDKTVMLMDKGEHVITAMLKEPYISSNGVYYIQLEGVKSDYRIISNSIRFEVGSFINANHIPTPEEQGIIDQLVIRVGEVEEGLRIVELTAEEAKDLARNAVPLTLYDEDMTQIDARINESTETINWFVTEFSATINDLFENIVRIENDVEGLQGSKQDTLVSGENIATINGHNLLDGGDIEIQGGGGSGMEYYKVTFDGTHILHDGVALTFNDVVAKYNDDNYFLYAEVYGLTMIPTLPPYEGDNILEFICTWIENGAVTISRLIINALNQVKFEDVEVAKKSDIPTVPTKTSELTNDSGFITARDVPAPYDDTEIREEVSAVGEEVSSVKADLSELDTNVKEELTEFKNACKIVNDFVSLDGINTTDEYINGRGVIGAGGSTKYHTFKCDVVEGKEYYITASTNYSNPYFAWYDSDYNLVELGIKHSGSPVTSIVREMFVCPQGATKLVLNWYDTGSLGVVETMDGYRQVGKWGDKKWACIGDSLTASYNYTDIHYFEYVAKDTDIQFVNLGENGSGYAKKDTQNLAFYQRVLNMDSDFDVVTIFGSFNDLGYKDIGTYTDSGTDTLAGCINTTIDNIISKMPTVNLGIVSPCPWSTTRPNFNENSNSYKYVNMLKTICEYRSIPYLDLWHNSNLRPWDADFRALVYSKDGEGGIGGTHPNEICHKLLAPHFKAFLETLII